MLEKELIEQTRRHSLIASLLCIPQVLVAINKMDLVEYDENRYQEIMEEYRNLARNLNFKGLDFIPFLP